MPETSATTSEPADSVVVVVNIADGQVTVAQDTLKVTYGQIVSINVTSDVEDEVHVHGFDVTGKVKPGELKTIDFRVKRSVDPGVYEVETHEGGLLLFQIELS